MSQPDQTQVAFSDESSLKDRDGKYLKEKIPSGEKIGEEKLRVEKICGGERPWGKYRPRESDVLKITIRKNSNDID